MCRLAGVAKKALRGDDSETPLAKNPFGSDGDRGRFAKGSAKAQVTEGLFSGEAIIHFAIVTAGTLFGHTPSLPRPFLASALPNPSPPAHFLTILDIFALGGDNSTQPAGVPIVHFWSKRANRGRQIQSLRYAASSGWEAGWTLRQGCDRDKRR